MNEQKIKDRIAGRDCATSLMEMAGDCLLEGSAEFHLAFWETIRDEAAKAFPQNPPEQSHQPIARLGATVMPFGAHARMTFDEVPLEYLDWLCRSQEDFYKDLRAYLKHPELEGRRRGLDS